MDNTDSFLVEFQLADREDISASEFRYFFEAIDELTRSLVIQQMYAFIAFARLSDRAKDEIHSSVWRYAPFVPTPAEIVSVRRESPWSVLASLPVVAVLWALRKMIAPEILEAWTESQLKEDLRQFVREGLFRGARKQIENSATTKNRYGNLMVDDVTESSFKGPDGPDLRVTLRRTDIVQVEVKDRELMNEFLSRIGIKPK